MSLRVRVVLAIAVVLLAASAMGTALAGWQARQVLREEIAAALAGGRQTIASAFEDLPRSDHPARDLAQLVATFDGNRHLTATLTEPDGRVREASRPLPTARAPGWFEAWLWTPATPVRVAAPVAGGEMIVLAPVYANDIRGLWIEFTRLALTLGGALIVGAVAIWFTLGRALGPLSAFSEAFRRIGSGDYGVSAPAEGPPELVRLGAGLNEMARRLGAMQARNDALEAQLRTLQDEERADLARDLHDEIGPHLFAAGIDAAMATRMIEAGETREALGSLAAIRTGVSHMQRLVRDILGRLSPTEPADLGLAGAVRELVAFWRGRLPAAAFETRLPPDDAAIPQAQASILYRVVQEGLSNAVRHGRPTRISVEVAMAEAGGIVARVADNGAPAKGATGAGRGLTGMRERVEAAGGRLDIEVGRVGGWTLTARLPVDPDPEARAA
ncbi:MAG: histidine kinase [Caulobacteraceae bacterium]